MNQDIVHNCNNSFSLERHNPYWYTTSWILGRTEVEFSSLLQFYAHEKEKQLLQGLIYHQRVDNYRQTNADFISHNYANGINYIKSTTYHNTDWFVGNETVTEHDNISKANKNILLAPLASEEVNGLIDFITIISKPKKIMSNNTFLYEPFQKLLILEIFTFLVKKLTPNYTNELLIFAKDKLGLCNLTEQEFSNLINFIDKKHSVHIIPRRHGKTKILSMILATALVCLKSIKLAYICHASKLISATYRDIVDAMETISHLVNAKRLEVNAQPITTTKIKDRNIHSYYTCSSDNVKKSMSQIEFIILHNALVSNHLQLYLLLTDLFLLFENALIVYVVLLICRRYFYHI